MQGGCGCLTSFAIAPQPSRAIPDQGLSLWSRLSECGQLSEKDLERDWAAAGPCVLVVFRFGESKVKQFRSRKVSFPDEPISHATRRFVVVAGPAAIEIDPEFSF